MNPPHPRPSPTDGGTPIRHILLCSELVLLACGVLSPQARSAAADWTAEPAVAQRLLAQEVVVETISAVDPEHPRGWIRAAVRINASPQAIWSVLTDCAQAVTYVPYLKLCRRVAEDPGGRWADIEHEVRFSRLLPGIDYVIHARYDPPRRIDFRRIRGDLNDEEGTWLLVAAPGATVTTVEYQVYIDPGFWVPHFLVNRSLRKDLPAALAGLRERAERNQTPAAGKGRAP
ncbi:MAG: SRPBCC family protein [Proteobacteria bacterium]|nr:SRPBCC family protein [Pseudomonadota bacterium]